MRRKLSKSELTALNSFVAWFNTHYADIGFSIYETRPSVPQDIVLAELARPLAESAPLRNNLCEELAVRLNKGRWGQTLFDVSPVPNNTRHIFSQSSKTQVIAVCPKRFVSGSTAQADVQNRWRQARVFLIDPTKGFVLVLKFSMVDVLNVLAK